MEKNIMEVEKMLPKDFNGTFYFTNSTDEDFIGVWGSKQYRFPKGTTSPMVMPNQTPLEVQQIRKKFAKDLAEREFFKDQNYTKLLSQERNSDGSPRSNSIHKAATYSLDQLTPYIQKCLIPLPEGRVQVEEIPTVPLEEKLSRNRKGKLNTQILGDREVSLEEMAREG